MRERSLIQRLPSRLVVALALAACTICCGAMLVARVLYTARGSTGPEIWPKFLVWNLFLAWIPYVCALVVSAGDERGDTRGGLLLVGAVWLAFFPNAPYIVTDLVHLTPSPTAPFWFDALLFTSFAWTGMLLGLVSLHLIHNVMQRHMRPPLARVIVVLMLALAGFGIYLGRFRRWNSWDIVADPTHFGADVTARLADPFGRVQATVVTMAFTAFLVVAYTVIRCIAQSGAVVPKCDCGRAIKSHLGNAPGGIESIGARISPGQRPRGG